MIAAALAMPGSTFANQAVKPWYEQFSNPKKKAYPWTFWYWMYGNVSDAGIKMDLHAMKEAGITGFYLMPIKSVADGRGLGVIPSNFHKNGGSGWVQCSVLPIALAWRWVYISAMVLHLPAAHG